MDTFSWLAISAALSVLLTGFLFIAFFAYGQGHKDGYRKGLHDGAEIQRQVSEEAQHAR